MKATITKAYSRKVSAKFQSEEFFTKVEKEIEFNSKEEYLAEHDKLAAQVKSLTTRDLEKYSDVLKTVDKNEPALVEERSS